MPVSRIFEDTPINRTIQLIGGKYKVSIVGRLMDGVGYAVKMAPVRTPEWAVWLVWLVCCALCVPLAAAYFFKNLAAEGKTKYIELNGEGTIDSIKETLISQLS